MRTEAQKRYYEKNKDIIKEKEKIYKKNYRSKNKDKLKKYLEENKEQVAISQKKYREKNKDILREKRKNKRYENHKDVLKQEREYRASRPEQIKASTEKYEQKYPERRKETQRKARQKRKSKDAQIKKDRYHSDIKFKTKILLRNRLYDALRNKNKAGSAVNDLGCTVEFFIKYIESLWLPGMTWDNWSQFGWHIDHIVPLSRFDLTNREDVLKACHYTNLQPLWAFDNLSKNDKLLGINNV